MKVGLFGGTFDPIHNGHISLAEQFLKELHLDEVWFLVTPQNPWKKDNRLSDDAFRLEVVKKALEGHKGLVASDYEFHLEKPSYSYKTLRHLREDYPETEFTLLIGADNWVKFDHWAEHEEILQNHNIAVYPREGYEVGEATMPEGVALVKTDLYNVSSTQIREMLSRGEDVSALVPLQTIELIANKYNQKKVKTAVVILNWNGAEMMRRFLPSVVENSMPDSEVWVADNASTDNSLEVLAKEFPTVKTLVLEKNWGFAEGYNKALSQIDAEYFVLLNSDVEVTPHWLEPLTKCLDENPDVVAVQPKILKGSMDTWAKDIENPMFEYAGASGGFVDKYGYPYCRGRLFGIVEQDKGQYDEPMEIHWATGACLMIRAKDYKESGGLDGRFFAHNEEIDLCWRLRIAGKKIMCLPESKVYHLGGGTLPQGNPRKTYLNFRNNLTMLYKNLPENRLKPVMRMRLVLDNVAALQSLLKGNMGDVKAIYNARKAFKEWKNDYSEDRKKIQSMRKLTANKDLTPISILWQFYALGKKKWDKLPSFILTLVMLLSASQIHADDKTRGIGVYPGRPSEDYSVKTVESNTFRNLSVNHAAYASSSIDHNLTAQLVTDGIAAKAEPPHFDVITSDVPLLSKREREWILDGIAWTTTTVKGESPRVKLEWVGMKVLADSVVVNYTVAYHADKANKGYDIRLLTEMPGFEYKELVHDFSQSGLPGVPMRYQIPLDPNKQSDRKETLPARKVRASYHITPTDSIGSLDIRLNMPGAEYWRVEDVLFFYKGQRLYNEVLSSSQFQSAWMSDGGGEQWVYVDLGAEASIEKMRLYWMHFAPKGQVEISDDARMWTKIAELPRDKGLFYEIDATGKGRYVRVVVNSSGFPYTMTELEVFGRGGTIAQPHPEAPVEGNTWSLNGGDWRIQRASEVKYTGDVVTLTGFPVKNWLPATVPGTVLTSYVNAGAVPNQNYDDNIFQTSESFFNSNFWYRREFKLPEEFKDKKIYLNLDGINWKAQLWLNGKKIGRVEGAFTRGRLDITDRLIPGENVLAIEIERCAHPGSVKEKNSYNTDTNGGALGLDNPTFHASVGWDWITTVRGRNIGIWNDISLTAEGDVTLMDPFVQTKLNLPDTLATLYPKVYIYNNVGKLVKGTLCGWIGNIHFEKQVEVRPGQATLRFEPEEFKQLRNQKLCLWWPNGYGDPYLYDAGFAFLGENGDTISVSRFKHGVREMTYKDKDTKLTIYCNGRRVVPHGGNWGFSEQNLNYRAREYDTAVRYHRDMNFNMIRNWVGQTGDDEFYDACDKYGIMVWQDFWLANPADGPDPADEGMFLTNAHNYLSRICRHPSIALYCGRNEGYPPENLNKHLESIVRMRHPGIEYIANSAAEGVSGHGPYWVIPAKEYFEKQTGQLHSERGMPNVMTYEGLKRTLRPEHLWPQNDYWGQHDFTMAGAQRGATFNKLVEQYGKSTSAEEFTTMAQFVNYDGYRAMFESDNVNRMGLLIWMSHACWPSMVWQCYDYYFEPTAAYFGCKKACEPLHIQLNASTMEAEVVNLGIGDIKKLKAEVGTYDISGKQLSKTTTKVNSLNDTTQKLAVVPTDGAALVRMKLLQGKKVVSENTYLLDPSKLADVSQVKVDVDAEFDDTSAILTLEAPKDAPAYMIRLNLLDGNGEQILPAMYGDNYFHLLPGEKKTVKITWREEDQHAEGVKLELSGYNMHRVTLE